MKIVGGLSFDNNEWVFSFASLAGGKIIPYMNIYGKTTRSYTKLEDFITENIDDIDSRISYIEKKHSFKTGKIFFELPEKYAGKKETENIIPLNVSDREKKIAYSDINFAKKQVENITLDLEDICLHHIVLEYKIGDRIFNSAPVGLWARKISLKSLIISIPFSLSDVFIDTFDNVDRRFSGFVYETLANYSIVHSGIAEGRSFIVNIKRNRTTISCFSKRRIISEKVYCFGSDSIVSYVAEKFSIPDEAASDIIFKFGSFYNPDSPKEVSVRNGDSYINVSISLLNNFIRDAVRDKISVIINGINREDKNYTVSFIGKIIQREGFYNFIEDAFNINVKRPLHNGYLPGAFGCIRYGITGMFENEGRDSLWHKIVRLYKSYF